MAGDLGPCERFEFKKVIYFTSKIGKVRMNYIANNGSVSGIS